MSAAPSREPGRGILENKIRRRAGARFSAAPTALPRHAPRHAGTGGAGIILGIDPSPSRVYVKTAAWESSPGGRLKNKTVLPCWISQEFVWKPRPTSWGILSRPRRDCSWRSCLPRTSWATFSRPCGTEFVSGVLTQSLTRAGLTLGGRHSGTRILGCRKSEFGLHQLRNSTSRWDPAGPAARSPCAPALSGWLRHASPACLRADSTPAGLGCGRTRARSFPQKRTKHREPGGC
jgi:hypothetical protein